MPAASVRRIVAIVCVVIAMARSLRLQGVAVGIETSAQLREPQGLGCDRGQGYLFCKGVDAGSTPKFARSCVLERVN